MTVDAVTRTANVARATLYRHFPSGNDLLAAAFNSLIPASPGLFDAILRLPIMDTTRARTVLRWEPRQSATETLKEFLTGLREREGAATQPLVARTGDRIRELLGGRRTPS